MDTTHTLPGVTRQNVDRSTWCQMGPKAGPPRAYFSAADKDAMFAATGCVGSARPRRAAGKDEKVIVVNGPPRNLEAGWDKAIEIVQGYSEKPPPPKPTGSCFAKASAQAKSKLQEVNDFFSQNAEVVHKRAKAANTNAVEAAQTYKCGTSTLPLAQGLPLQPLRGAPPQALHTPHGMLPPRSPWHWPQPAYGWLNLPFASMPIPPPSVQAPMFYNRSDTPPARADDRCKTPPPLAAHADSGKPLSPFDMPTETHIAFSRERLKKRKSSPIPVEADGPPLNAESPASLAAPTAIEAPASVAKSASVEAAVSLEPTDSGHRVRAPPRIRTESEMPQQRQPDAAAAATQRSGSEPQKAPEAHTKPLGTVKFYTCGHNHLQLTHKPELNFDGSLTYSSSRLVHQNIIDTILPERWHGSTRPTLILDVGWIPLDTVAPDHCGHHKQKVASMVDRLKCPLLILASQVWQFINSNLHRGGKVNVVLTDATGDNQSVTLSAILVDLFKRLLHYKCVHTRHLHKSQWRCSGSCEDCNKGVSGSDCNKAIRRASEYVLRCCNMELR